MNELTCPSLGETWLNLVHLTLQNGQPLQDEAVELLEARVGFPAETEGDELIMRFGDHRMVAAMERVFFAEGDGMLGHEYASLMRGPDGRKDLTDVISLLEKEPSSKRAVVTLCGQGGGKVPCVNVLQFLVRGDEVHTIYFARGQDAYKKFYADALCIAKLARRVADGVGRSAGKVTGFIGSSHVYNADRSAVAEFLSRGQWFLQHPRSKAVSV